MGKWWKRSGKCREIVVGTVVRTLCERGEHVVEMWWKCRENVVGTWWKRGEFQYIVVQHASGEFKF